MWPATGKNDVHTPVTSVKLDPVEPSLMSKLGAQHESVDQMVDLRNRHLPGGGEHEVVKEQGQETRLPRSETNRTRSERRIVPRATACKPIRGLPSRMGNLHYGQSPVGRVYSPIRTSVDGVGKILERLERSIIEGVGYDHVSSEGQVIFIDLGVPGDDHPPPSLAPVLVHSDVGVSRRATSKFASMFIHCGLDEGWPYVSGFPRSVRVEQTFISLFGATLPHGNRAGVNTWSTWASVILRAVLAEKQDGGERDSGR